MAPWVDTRVRWETDSGVGELSLGTAAYLTNQKTGRPPRKDSRKMTMTPR